MRDSGSAGDSSPPPIIESNNLPPYLSKTHNNTEKKLGGKDFCSATFRNALITACVKATGHSPYPWQMDATEAVYLGLDCIVMAGTGYGKTLPFGLIHLVEDNLVTFVISPLNVLQHDQVSLDYHCDQ
jgi:ATP-dependent helicase YprA (DUF1998 family)